MQKPQLSQTVDDNSPPEAYTDPSSTVKDSQQEGSFHLSYNIAFLYSVTEVYGVFRKRVLLVSFFVVLSAHLTVPCLSNPR